MSTTLAPTDPRSLHYQRHSPTNLAAAVMSTIDTKDQGYIDKDELKAAVLKLTTTKLNGGDTAEGANKLDALFKKLDADGDGKITKSELEAAIKKMSPGRHVQAPETKAMGQDTAGLTTYEPADKNKDGTVSATELLVYEVHQTEKAIAQANAGAAPQIGQALSSGALARRELAYSAHSRESQAIGADVTTTA